MKNEPKSNPPKPKTKKPTVAQLEQELGLRILELQTQLDQAQQQLAGYRAAEQKSNAERGEVLRKLGVAKAALKPFREKTAQWRWPGDGIQAIAPLTFGDLRAARDAASALGA